MTAIDKIRAALLAESDETEKFRAALTALAELETELATLRDRLRKTAQTLVDCIGTAGPENADEAAERAARLIESRTTEIAALRVFKDAIDEAPTVATIRPVTDSFYRFISATAVDFEDLPPAGAELIVRPEAK